MKVEELGTKLDSIALLLSKTMQGHANASLEHINHIAESEIIALYGKTNTDTLCTRC